MFFKFEDFSDAVEHRHLQLYEHIQLDLASYASIVLISTLFFLVSFIFHLINLSLYFCLFCV